MKKYLIVLTTLALLTGTVSLGSAAETQTPTGTKKVVPKKAVKAKKVVKKAVKQPVKTVKKAATPVPASTPTPAKSSSTPAKKTHAVDIKDFAFTPSELKIKTGDSVIFTQRDGTIHTVDTDPHPQHTQLLGFDSGSLSQGQSYTHTFTKAGTFSYHCSPHPNMTAKIVVEE